MNLIKIAVEERTKQLTRKMNSESNPMIKQIITDEIRLLKEEWDKLPKPK